MKNSKVPDFDTFALIVVLFMLFALIMIVPVVFYKDYKYRQTCKPLPGYYREAILVDINQPKHFVGTFIDIDADGEYLSGRKEHRSKHCNGWRKLRVGMRFKYYTKREKCEDGQFADPDESLHEVLCGE